MARKLDPIKQGLAQALQHYFVTGPDRPALLPTPADVLEVEGSIISSTEVQVRVKTTDAGTRYFTYKLTEHM
jgi:hypothetical protein